MELFLRLTIAVLAIVSGYAIGCAVGWLWDVWNRKIQK